MHNLRIENFDFDENFKKLKKIASIILRQKAIDHLNDIWDYTFTFEYCSESKTGNYYSSTKLVCNLIVQHPDLGKIYDKISKNILGLKN